MEQYLLEPADAASLFETHLAKPWRTCQLAVLVRKGRRLIRRCRIHGRPFVANGTSGTLFVFWNAAIRQTPPRFCSTWI